MAFIKIFFLNKFSESLVFIPPLVKKHKYIGFNLDIFPDMEWKKLLSANLGIFGGLLLVCRAQDSTVQAPETKFGKL